jgi:hypothetical protein
LEKARESSRMTNLATMGDDDGPTLSNKDKKKAKEKERKKEKREKDEKVVKSKPRQKVQVNIAGLSGSGKEDRQPGFSNHPVQCAKCSVENTAWVRNVNFSRMEKIEVFYKNLTKGITHLKDKDKQKDYR